MNKIWVLLVLIIGVIFADPQSQLSLKQIYGVWHCGDDGCLWAVPTTLSNSKWLLNRGDGKPTANLVILSFINPVALLQKTTNQETINGVPRGFTTEVVSFFQNASITVQFSIGGASYAGLWDQALASDPTTLAKNAAAVAKQFNVGMEIDYENDNDNSLNALDTFVDVYRSIIPYDNSITPSPPSILTVDLGAGTGYLTGISQHASGWLNSSICNWANAMVSSGPWQNVDDASPYWLEHLHGTSWAHIPPMDPTQLLVSNYLTDGAPICNTYSGTVLEGTIGWVNNYTTRGLMFWAAGCCSGSDCGINCSGLQKGSEAYTNY